MNGNYNCRPALFIVATILLPIREAYEWKRLNAFTAFAIPHPKTCFQFVKRMNGNLLMLK